MTGRSLADLLRPGTLIDGRRPDQPPRTRMAGGNNGPAARGDRSHHFLPGRSDYPAALLTRRSFGLEAARIVQARANAPCACGAGRGRGQARCAPG
ncbi:MAG TPA: hypothetical protein VML55_05330 [Planctomycetaceae bacterium]|nr:hypothetical protein [Planctomycetaceae bacterium]